MHTQTGSWFILLPEGTEGHPDLQASSYTDMPARLVTFLIGKQCQCALCWIIVPKPHKFGPAASHNDLFQREFHFTVTESISKLRKVQLLV